MSKVSVRAEGSRNPRRSCPAPLSGRGGRNVLLQPSRLSLPEGEVAGHDGFSVVATGAAAPANLPCARPATFAGRWPAPRQLITTLVEPAVIVAVLVDTTMRAADGAVVPTIGFTLRK